MKESVFHFRYNTLLSHTILDRGFLLENIPRKRKMEHGKEYISSGGTRNSMELVKFCVQSGATGRQSVDESPTDGFPAERTVGNIAPRDQRCVSLRGPCALDAFDRSSRIYLYSIEQPHLVPLAVSHSPCGRPRGKI